MPYPTGHRDEVRTRIVRSAQQLFNRHGFESVSIDNIMAATGLTRGGFYRYFNSKSELYAEALDCFFTNPQCGNHWEGVQVEPDKGEIGAQIVRAYLSRQHREDVENSCPMVALVGDAARTGPAVQRAYERALEAMVEHLRLDAGENGLPNRQTALAIAGLCIGAMSVARASDGIGAEMLAAAKHVALKLGGWRDLDPIEA